MHAYRDTCILVYTRYMHLSLSLLLSVLNDRNRCSNHSNDHYRCSNHFNDHHRCQFSTIAIVVETIPTITIVVQTISTITIVVQTHIYISLPLPQRSSSLIALCVSPTIFIVALFFVVIIGSSFVACDFDSICFACFLLATLAATVPWFLATVHLVGALTATVPWHWEAKDVEAGLDRG